jgi:hypothetical protein
MTETYEAFTRSIETYVGGVFAFAQEALKLFFDHHGTASLSENGGAEKRHVNLHRDVRGFTL